MPGVARSGVSRWPEVLLVIVDTASLKTVFLEWSVYPHQFRLASLRLDACGCLRLLLQKRRRHTETRETAWTLPSSDRELRSAESHQQSAAATSATTQTTASAAAPVSRDKMLSQLLDAVQGDQTGMLFAETARSLRYDCILLLNSLSQ